MNQMHDSDEEEEEIEWEDVDTSKESCANLEAEEKDNFKLPNRNWQDIESAVNKELQKEQSTSVNSSNLIKKRKRKRKLSSHEKNTLLQIHKTHLLCLLAREIKAHQAVCNDRQIQASLLSIIPPDSYLLNFNSSTISYKIELQIIKSMVNFFRKEFRLLPYRNSSSFDQYDLKSILSVIHNRKGFSHQLLLLFVSLSRSLGLETRYAFSAAPKRLSSISKVDICSFGVSGEDTLSYIIQEKDSGNNPTTTKLKTIESLPPMRTWAEICITDSKKDAGDKRWLFVDPIRCLIDERIESERFEGRGKFLPYVLSIDANERIVDTTMAYTSNWGRVKPFRIPPPFDTWWLETLSRLSHHNSNKITESSSGLEFMSHMEQPSNYKEDMPKTLIGFKTSETYCLERHLGENEAVYPEIVVGTFKGERIFMKRNIHELRTCRAWIKEGRQITKDQITSPFKTLNKGKRVELLYGEWQTIQYSPEPMVDGKIPKNEYGNIEIWSTSHVPFGAVHLKIPRIATVAKHLGIDYAKALVGFEVKKGVTYPVFDGIIVCEEMVEILEAAQACFHDQNIEKAIKKNQLLLVKRWERVVQKYLLRRRLQKDYGKFQL